MGLRPAVFDRHVLALHEASFLETFVERAQTVRVRLRRFPADKSNYWNSGLLCARRRERPCGYGASNTYDEFSAAHVTIPLRPRTTPVRLGD